MGAAPAALGDAAVIDSLSAWIVSTLAPISDADPAVLGKYVLALLKKDEPLAVLRGNCARELADFLEDQTGEFVDALFARIDHEIERHDARAAAAAAADTGGTAEEDEVDYGEGSDSEESKDERPRGRREKEKDDAGVDDCRDERPGSGRSDDRRDGERRARDAREVPERRRGRRPGSTPGRSRSPGRSRLASRDRGYRGAPRFDRRPQFDRDRRDRARSPEGGRFDGREPHRRPPPGPPPAVPPPAGAAASCAVPDAPPGRRRARDSRARGRHRALGVLRGAGTGEETLREVSPNGFRRQAVRLLLSVRRRRGRSAEPQKFYATVVFEDAESARRAVRYRRVLFWGKELANVETRWALPDEEIERRREEKIREAQEEREAAARRRTEEAEERERNRQKAVEALRVKREAARKLAAIEAEKRALEERLEAATAPKTVHAAAKKKGKRRGGCFEIGAGREGAAGQVRGDARGEEAQGRDGGGRGEREQAGQEVSEK